ncbi:hypothetical protein C8J57DRAFT_1255287 [Mycena rebaudengoi]|nr:hypothetical protein C8J57DRAFT_1255287 [Mycena rebaudengoi]
MAATSSVAENFAKAPNPTPLVTNLVTNMPSTIARNDNAGNSGDIADAPSPGPRVAGDGGPAGYNSSGPGANGSGFENLVANPCPYGEGIFTRPHIVEMHEKSRKFQYHDRTKPIKGTLYRMEVDLKFRCICDAKFALIADIDAHFKEIEEGKHRGHGQSYTSTHIGKMRQYSQQHKIPHHSQ